MSVDESVHLHVGIETYFHWAQWSVIPAVEREKKRPVFTEFHCGEY